MTRDEFNFRMILLFLDGLGIGENNPAKNPCTLPSLRHLAVFLDRGILRSRDEDAVAFPVDATLGVDGLPQSATGQTTLLSGQNAARAVGRHLPGYPDAVCREILRKHSILKQVTDLGFEARFINVFRPVFFDLPPGIQWRLSATTVANLAAGLPFQTLDDLRARRALYHDFSNRYLLKKGFDVPALTPREAGHILAESSRNRHLTLYEYFLTDRAGHSRDMTAAQTILGELELFLTALLESVDLTKTLVVLTSDHGNIEDLSTNTHTLSPAMTLAWGREKHAVQARVETLADFAPLFIRLLEENADKTASSNQKQG